MRKHVSKKVLHIYNYKTIIINHKSSKIYGIYDVPLTRSLFVMEMGFGNCV